MLLVRMVFHAKFGKAGEIIATLKQGREISTGNMKRARILTDLSGRFDRVVMEFEAESLADFERERAELYANPQYQEVGSRMTSLFDWGYSEFYTVEG
jgi:hypothetical protein